jgi:hypothetical protein
MEGEGHGKENRNFKICLFPFFLKAQQAIM